MNTYLNTAIRWSASLVCCLLALSAVILAVWMGTAFFWIPTLPLAVVAAAFFRAGYLVFYRWSPLAIRHLVGALFFLLTVWLITVVREPKRCLGVLIASYAVYRFVALQWARHEFPNTISGAGKS